MEIKEFFRPKLNKIILALMIWIFIPQYLCGTSFVPPYNNICYFAPYSGGYFSLWFLVLDNQLINLVYGILFFILSYSLSCMIIFTYEQIKSKSKK